MAEPTSSGRKVVLLIGTVKGMFIYQSDAAREDWTLSGPHLAGAEVFSLCGDPRRGRILAGTEEFMSGPMIKVSADFGATWSPVAQSPALPAGAKTKLKHIWTIVPGHPSQPGTWYVGVDDAALFVSRDDGDTWNELTGLTNHPSRPHWVPGFGGLCLHSIVVDPHDAQRLWVAISAVGVFRTTDGGETWTLCNHGLPNVAPEFIKGPDMGRCVHRLALDPAQPGALAMQFHGGVYTSTDGADSWQKVSDGLSHDFGFPIGVTQRDLFVVPLLGGENRIVPDGALKVWRSSDRGRVWRALTKGLPQENHFVDVLRNALATDPLSPAGIYFGTTSGELFYSRDDGDTWQALPARFPRVTTVQVWML